MSPLRIFLRSSKNLTTKYLPIVSHVLLFLSSRTQISSQKMRYLFVNSMRVTFTVHRFKGAAFGYYYSSRLIINKS
jgi:hypothetical protein